MIKVSDSHYIQAHTIDEVKINDRNEVIIILKNGKVYRIDSLSNSYSILQDIVQQIDYDMSKIVNDSLDRLQLIANNLSKISDTVRTISKVL